MKRGNCNLPIVGTLRKWRVAGVGLDHHIGGYKLKKGTKMQKISPSRLSFVSAVAAMIGIADLKGYSTAAILSKKRGKAPKGMRFTSSSVYWPGGPFRNTADAVTRNPKVIANVQMMHEKWLASRRAVV